MEADVEREGLTVAELIHQKRSEAPTLDLRPSRKTYLSNFDLTNMEPVKSSRCSFRVDNGPIMGNAFQIGKDIYDSQHLDVGWTVGPA